MSASTPVPSLTERIATLEERTRVKPKTWLDIAKDWGGVASLVIALAYSFPLGLLDRFVFSERQREEAEVRRLRGVIEQSAQLMTEAAKTLSAIIDPQQLDNARRSLYTQLHMAMLKNKAEFLRIRDQLTPTEAVVVANNFLQTEQPEAALAMARAAFGNPESTTSTRIESLRVEAKIHFLGKAKDRLPQARSAFAKALQQLDNAPRQLAASQHVALRSEWAMLELMDGDWACGQAQMALARQAFQANAALLVQALPFMQMVEQQIGAVPRRPGQNETGCETLGQ